jgi:hypothetical protein
MRQERPRELSLNPIRSADRVGTRRASVFITVSTVRVAMQSRRSTRLGKPLSPGGHRPPGESK